MQKYTVAGLMSGTSLDGLDICLAKFVFNKKWSFTIHAAQTVKYPADILLKLKQAHLTSAEKLTELDWEYGYYIGKTVNKFLLTQKTKLDFIASHGHTIFHQPEKGYTLQIGKGAAIAAETKLVTINDFRSNDVALSGQGAPLVPIGDLLLFSDYDACINLGGFANISYKNKNKEIIAYDICPVNISINHYCQKLQLEFDKNGLIAAEGKINDKLLNQLNKLSFYKKPPPKSLGREWIEKNFLPLIDNSEKKIENKIATITEHASAQIASALSKVKAENMLFTGGGAFNKHLINRIEYHLNKKITLPEKSIINFKEALIFGFLGVLRYRNEINCLSSVTGASKNNCGGIINLP